MKVIRDNLWLCDQCTVAAVNDDYTGLQYRYISERHANDKMLEIQKGLEKLGPNLVPDFITETLDGVNSFSKVYCDCCGDHLYGERFRFAILGE